MSIPHKNPQTPTGTLYEPLPKTCMNCKYWRIKSSVGENGRGICMNDIVNEQINMISEAAMARYFTAGKDDHEKQQNAETISNSLRFHSKFGCLHFEQLEP